MLIPMGLVERCLKQETKNESIICSGRFETINNHDDYIKTKRKQENTQTIKVKEMWQST